MFSQRLVNGLVSLRGPLSESLGDEVVPGRVLERDGHSPLFLFFFFALFGRITVCQVARSRCIFVDSPRVPFRMVDTTSNGGSLGSRVDEDRSKARQGVVNCRIQ